jgi:manganese/zinc/iron transport system permease protein
MFSGNTPYWGKNFFEFFIVFFTRIFSFAKNEISFSDLAIDEIQVLVLSGIAISCSLVGCFLVLKKQTMLANALSHTILLGIVLAYIVVSFIFHKSFFDHSLSIPIMFLASLFSAFLTVFLNKIFTKYLRLKEDASIGLVFSFIFALSIVLASIFTKNVHIGIEVIMGNAEILYTKDLILVVFILILNLFIVLLFFKEFHVTAFDSSLASSLGISPSIFQNLLMFQTSATIIGAFRVVGVLLVISFIVGPVLIARLFTHNLKTLLFLSAIIGCGASIAGVALSRHLLSVYQMPFSTTGTVVVLLSIIFIFSVFFSKKKRVCFLLKKAN